jgi:uncharacterized protein YlxW (UPF0749 family)
MVINLSEEHKYKILYYIEEYRKISDENYNIYEKVKSLQEEINKLTEKLKNSENSLNSIRDEERKYIEDLHSIYGDFNLNDIWETVFKN